MPLHIFLSRERKACLMLHNILETIRHYKVITLFFSIPINIYLYFIGKLVQQITVLPFAIVILDSFLLLYCRIDWELTRHFVWVIEEINGVVIFHLVCSFTMELHLERMMGLEMLLYIILLVQITISNHNFPYLSIFSPCSIVKCFLLDTRMPHWINELSVIPYKNILNNFIETWETDNPKTARAGLKICWKFLKRILLNI